MNLLQPIPDPASSFGAFDIEQSSNQNVRTHHAGSFTLLIVSTLSKPKLMKTNTATSTAIRSQANLSHMTIGQALLRSILSLSHITRQWAMCASLVTVFMMSVGVSWGQLLQWNTFGNTGTETTEPSVSNAAGISSANLTLGSVTPAANGNRFGGNNWFDTGDSNPTTLAESVSGNDYIEFVVTPSSGYVFTPTTLNFIWDRSGTGPSDVTLRSSIDGYSADIATVSGIVSASFAVNSMIIPGMVNLASPVTFRLFAYNATSTVGTGGFDVSSDMVNVELLGTANCLVRNVNNSVYYCTLQDAINAASNGNTLELLTDITEGLVTVNKAVTIDGQGFTLTSSSATWGIVADVPGVTIQNITVEDAGTFGIITECGADNLTITNTTVTSCGGTGFALNGVDNVVLTNITALNNIGNGLSISDCNNVTISGITTSGNAFGGGFSAGIGIFSGGACSPPAGISNITIAGTLGEPVQVYSQILGGVGTISGLTLPPALDYFAGIGNGSVTVQKYFMPSLANAYTTAASLIAAPSSVPATLIHVEKISTGNQYVGDNLAPAPPQVGTYDMSINAAITYMVATKTVFIEAGSFAEKITGTKSLIMTGAGMGSTILDGTGLGIGNGITINNGVTNVTIQDLTVKSYLGASGNANAGIYAIGGNNNLTVQDVDIADNVGGSGFYANGPITNVLLDNVDAHGHTVGARGIVIWNGLKSNITITNCEVYGNNCCGIELQDGTATGVTMIGNNVHDNGDNGIGIVGMQSPGANLIQLNTVTNNGRFGIEIKNPDGSGASSGAGSIVVNNNTVTRPEQ